MNDLPAQILVVDDDMMARMEVAQYAKKLGHDVTMASDGANALELLRSKKFDLVLLDLVMPEIDGFEVLGQIRLDDRLRETPVIMVSGTEEDKDIEKCIEMGAVGHIAKPIFSNQFASEVTRCLREKNT